MHERHIDREDAVIEQLRDLVQVNMRRVGETLVDGFAHVAANEQRVVAEMPLHFLGGVPRLSDCEDMIDLHVAQFVGACDHRLDQHFRDGAAGVNIDMISGLDRLHRIFRGFDLTSINGHPFHKSVPSSESDSIVWFHQQHSNGSTSIP